MKKIYYCLVCKRDQTFEDVQPPYNIKNVSTHGRRGQLTNWHEVEHDNHRLTFQSGEVVGDSLPLCKNHRYKETMRECPNSSCNIRGGHLHCIHQSCTNIWRETWHHQAKIAKTDEILGSA